MRFWTYFGTSLVAAISVVVYAIQTREQFYPVILFLVTSKVAFVINANMLLATSLLFGKMGKMLFLGSLRDAEMEMLYERIKYAVTDICLALTIFRHELTPTIIALFGTLLFVKAFHWLCSARLDYLDQVMPASYWTQIRLSMLILMLIICDVGVTYSCIQYTIQHGKSVLILFGFEFGLLCIMVLNLVCRFAFHLLDSNLANGFPSKGLFIMVVDLFCDAIKFVTYVFFFCLVFVYYGLPIHIIREVWSAFFSFQKKLVSFIRYLKLTRNLDQRFENATAEELSEAGDCLICRECMESGKKLPCGHVFHMDCLRMWLQHQQTCPLCRAEIPINSTRPLTSTLGRVPPPVPPRDAADVNNAPERPAAPQEDAIFAEIQRGLNRREAAQRAARDTRPMVDAFEANEERESVVSRVLGMQEARVEAARRRQGEDAISTGVSAAPTPDPTERTSSPMSTSDSIPDPASATTNPETEKLSPAGDKQLRSPRRARAKARFISSSRDKTPPKSPGRAPKTEPFSAILSGSGEEKSPENVSETKLERQFLRAEKMFVSAEGRKDRTRAGKKHSTKAEWISTALCGPTEEMFGVENEMFANPSFYSVTAMVTIEDIVMESDGETKNKLHGSLHSDENVLQAQNEIMRSLRSVRSSSKLGAIVWNNTERQEVVRIVPQDTLIFVVAHRCDAKGNNWYRIPDGWVTQKEPLPEQTLKLSDGSKAIFSVDVLLIRMSNNCQRTALLQYFSRHLDVEYDKKLGSMIPLQPSDRPAQRPSAATVAERDRRAKRAFMADWKLWEERSDKLAAYFEAVSDVFGKDGLRQLFTTERFGELLQTHFDSALRLIESGRNKHPSRKTQHQPYTYAESSPSVSELVAMKSSGAKQEGHTNADLMSSRAGSEAPSRALSRTNSMRYKVDHTGQHVADMQNMVSFIQDGVAGVGDDTKLKAVASALESVAKQLMTLQQAVNDCAVVVADIVQEQHTKAVQNAMKSGSSQAQEEAKDRHAETHTESKIVQSVSKEVVTEEEGSTDPGVPVPVDSNKVSVALDEGPGGGSESAAEDGNPDTAISETPSSSVEPIEKREGKQETTQACKAITENMLSASSEAVSDPPPAQPSSMRDGQATGSDTQKDILKESSKEAAKEGVSSTPQDIRALRMRLYSRDNSEEGTQADKQDK
jgi:E3 ubiquitin-protein ligase synoviolin